ncbi:hypothetical protein PUNSTDRAFT_59888 [Punctularia strigosozonata HHB-11173 SS5]|uniref:uncharacterized protein n=1 Tax=Punctularia strigosozonata (strain HHB-11173) TaxID=741275 RepID=UPI00044166BA|nr:uncharacterized protein PUNSTDRAFT_59888 [Punctularia strigosozonata HHB-11173 SS5]EIN12965.1 hypothetical protein PUNSTDRAFT_59888 [Punctularia strigosozonata HHB-11173 SS5]
MDARWAEERRRLSWISQVSVRPFTPSESFAFPKPPGSEKTKGVQTATHSPQASIASVPETSETNDTYHTAVAVSSESPFADPTELKNPFLDVVHLKPIKRSYIPYRGDELGVQRGEDVSVLKYFGDGWALVERSLNGVVETGLIPQACFQDA